MTIKGQPVAAYPTPRDLPGLRHDLAQWYATDAATQFACTVAEVDQETGRQMAARHCTTVGAAGMYFVNGDMTDLAVQIGRGLDTFAVLPDEDLPEDHGLLVWAHRFIEPEANGMRFAPLAVTWSAVGAHIDVTLYEHLPTAQPPMPEAYRRRYGTPAPCPARCRIWCRCGNPGCARTAGTGLGPPPRTPTPTRTVSCAPCSPRGC